MRSDLRPTPSQKRGPVIAKRGHPKGPAVRVAHTDLPLERLAVNETLRLRLHAQRENEEQDRDEAPHAIAEPGP